MLNEFLEFEAYTKNPTSENPRLQPMMLTHSFSISRYGNYYLDGIDQVLIIIARHFIFSECGKTSDNIVESTIQDVDNHLYKDLYEKAVDLLVKTKLELEQIKMENA